MWFGIHLVFDSFADSLLISLMRSNKMSLQLSSVSYQVSLEYTIGQIQWLCLLQCLTSSDSSLGEWTCWAVQLGGERLSLYENSLIFRDSFSLYPFVLRGKLWVLFIWHLTYFGGSFLHAGDMWDSWVCYLFMLSWVFSTACSLSFWFTFISVCLSKVSALAMFEETSWMKVRWAAYHSCIRRWT